MRHAPAPARPSWRGSRRDSQSSLKRRRERRITGESGSRAHLRLDAGGVPRRASGLGPAGQQAGLLPPIRELSFVELLVLVDVEVPHVLLLGLPWRERTK